MHSLRITKKRFSKYKAISLPVLKDKQRKDTQDLFPVESGRHLGLRESFSRASLVFFYSPIFHFTILAEMAVSFIPLAIDDKVGQLIFESTFRCMKTILRKTEEFLILQRTSTSVLNDLCVLCFTLAGRKCIYNSGWVDCNLFQLLEF